MTTALIVGGDAPIGSAIAAACSARGMQVQCTSRRPDSPHLYLDITAPIDTWNALPRADVAYLCIVNAKLDLCETQPDVTGFINVVQMQKLAEKLLAQGTHLVFFSTNQVFDGEKPMRTIDEPTSPQSRYGKQKAELEAWLLAQTTPVSVIRLTKVIAASLPIKPLIEQWKTTLLRGECINAFTDLVFAPLPIANVVHGAITLGTKRCSGIFHLSGLEDISFFQAAAHLAQRLGVNQDLVLPTPAASKGILPQLRPKHTTLRPSHELLNTPIPAPLDVLDAITDLPVSV